MNTNKITTNNQDPTLTYYLNQISKAPLLTAEEERVTILLAQSGNQRARDTIVNSNLRFVVSIAKKFTTSKFELSDLISEGNLGLLRAIDKFDVSKGYKFISYAVHWIRQAIFSLINENGSFINLPANRVADLAKIKKIQDQYVSDNGYLPSNELVADLLELDVSLVNDLLASSQTVASLDQTLSDDSDTAFSDIFVSDTYSSEELAIQDALKTDIDNVLNVLNEREKDIITLRYGLNNTAPLSLHSIGEEYNLTKERIRQIEKRALAKITTNTSKSILESYLIA